MSYDLDRYQHICQKPHVQLKYLHRGNPGYQVTSNVRQEQAMMEELDVVH